MSRILLFIATIALALGQANVGMTKGGPPEMLIGDPQEQVFTLNIANAGPQTATNIVVTDTLPAGYVFAGVQGFYSPLPNPVCSYNATSRTVTCTIDNIIAGNAATVKINVTVPVSTLPFTSINTACAYSEVFDPNPTDNCNSHTNLVSLSADLKSTIDGASGGIAGQENNNTEFVTVQNLGFSPSNVKTTYRLPPFFIFLESSDPRCVFDNLNVNPDGTKNLTCDFGVMQPGTQIIFSVTSLIPANTPQGTYTAVVCSFSSNGVKDPNPTNNCASHNLNVVVQSDTSVTKGVLPEVCAGAPLQQMYTLVVQNAGPSDADGTELSDKIPDPYICTNYTIVCNVTPRNSPARRKRAVPMSKEEELELVMHEMSSREGADCGRPLSCQLNNNNLYCPIGRLNVFERVRVFLSCSTPSSAFPPNGVFPWERTNSARVSTTTFDSDLSRNVNNATNRVILCSDVAVEKTGPTNTIISGDGNTYFYTIAVSSVGLSDAYNVTLVDNVPSPLIVTGDAQLVSGAASCSRSGNNINCNLGTIPTGGQTILRVPFVVPSSISLQQTFINCANTTARADQNKLNDGSCWPIVVVPAPFVNISKTGPPSIEVSSNPPVYTYTIVIQNLGPTIALDGEIRDTLPEGFIPTGGYTLEPNIGSCIVTVATRTVRCSLGVLGVPDRRALFIPFKVDPSTTVTSVVNTAYVFTTTPNANPVREANSSTVLIRNANLQLTKSGVTPVCAGDQTPGAEPRFVLTITNLGPTDAVNVALTDVVPSELVAGPINPVSGSGISITKGGVALSPSLCSLVNNRLQCDNLGPLAVSPLQTIVVSFPYYVLSTQPATTVTNRANTSSTVNDPDPTNNVAFFDVTICNKADLQITKTATKSQVVAGGFSGSDGASWVVRIQNNGPSVANTVEINDDLPSDFAYTVGPVAISSSSGAEGGSCAVSQTGANYKLKCTFTRVQVSGFAEVAVPFTAGPSVLPGNRTNCANVTSLTPEVNDQNNKACADILVVVQATVSIVKSGPGELCAGEGSGYYKVDFSNNGPSTIQSAVLSDPIPQPFVPDLTLPITLTPNGSGSCSWGGNGRTLTCNIGTMNVGTPFSVSYPVKVPNTAPKQDNVQNTATITYTRTDSTTGQSSASAFTNICNRVVLSILKTAPAIVGAGSTGNNYGITLTNNGPALARSVTIVDDLKLPFLYGTPVPVPTPGSDGGCSTSLLPDLVTLRLTCTWPGLELAVGGSVSVTIPFNVPVTAVNGTLVRNCADGSALYAATVTSCANTVVEALANLSINKEGAGRVCAGGPESSFVVTVTNSGPAVALNVIVNDTLNTVYFTPNLAKQINVVALQGTLPAGATCGWKSDGKTMECNLGTMTVNNQIQITYYFKVASNVPRPGAKVPNTATVYTTSIDDTTNNQDTFLTEICFESDLYVRKSGPVEVTAGDGLTYTYTLVFGNNGISDAIDAYLVDDEIPTEFDVQGQPQITAPSDGGVCSYSSTTRIVQCTWPVMAVGKSYTVTFPFTVGKQQLAGTVRNCVDAPADQQKQFDPNTNNNRNCTDTVIKVASAVGLQKFGPTNACPNGVTAGDKIVYFYTLRVTNNGPSIARDLVITDELPNGLDISGTPSPSPACRWDGRTVRCNFAQLDTSAGSNTIDIVFGFTAPQNLRVSSVTNFALLQVPNDSTPNDNNPSLVTPICQKISPTIVKTVTPQSIVAGDQNNGAKFTLEVGNGGPSDAFGITVTDLDLVVGKALAANVQVLTITSPRGTCSLATMSCTFDALVANAPKDVITITYYALSSATPGTYINCANVVSASPGGSAQDCKPVTIIAQANIVTTKAGPDQVIAGVNGPLSPNEFVVTVSNQGGSDAVNVKVEDSVPAVFKLVSVSPSECNIVDPNTVRCEFPRMIPGDRRVIRYRFDVAPNADLGSYINTACASTITDLKPGGGPLCASHTTKVVCQVNNVVNKDDGVTQVTAGDGRIYRFTVRVTNTNGPSTSRDTVLTDTWPSVYTVVEQPAVVGGLGTCGVILPGGTSFTCNLGVIDVNQYKEVVIGYKVNSDVTATSATNTACVTNSCTQSPVKNPNCDDDTNIILQNADLFIIKDDCVSEVEAGRETPYVFTITAKNNGPSDAQNVVISDQWPSVYLQGTIETSPVVQCTITGKDFSCPFGTVAAGDEVRITVRYTVDGNTPPQYATNCAKVTSTTPDSNTDNNEDCDTNVIVALADLEVTKTIDNKDCITAGDLANTRSYTVVVKNLGPATSRNVVLVDKFPQGMTVTGYPAECDPPVGGNYTCRLGDFVKGQSKTLVWNFRAPADKLPGLIENHVTVFADTPDPELCNNNATVCAIVCAVSDLRVSKADNVTVVTAGDGIEYVYTVTGCNDGPSDAYNVVLEDFWPAGFKRGTVTPLTPDGQVFFTQTGFYVKYPVIPVFRCRTFVVSYTVPACLLDCEECNTVQIRSDNPDPVPNNSAQDCNRVRTEADLSVCKTDGVTSIVAGNEVVYRYTVVVENFGPSCAQDVRLIDYFPKAVTQIPGSIIASTGRCINVNGTDISCNYYVLQPGDKVTLYVNYTVPSTAHTCSITNIAIASSSTFDPDLCNNQASDVNQLTESAELTVSKLSNVEVVDGSSNQAYWYTIQVGNKGPSTARDVMLTDIWPTPFLQFLESLTISKGKCRGVGYDFSCAIGDLDKNEQVTVKVSWSVKKPVEAGLVKNVVSVFSPTDVQCRDADVTVRVATPASKRETVVQKAAAEPAKIVRTAVVSSFAAPAESKEASKPQGQMLAPKLLQLEVVSHSVESGKAVEVEIKVRNPLHHAAVLDGVELLVGGRTVSLSHTGAEVLSSTCGTLKGMRLGAGWTGKCRATLSSSTAKDATVQVQGLSTGKGVYRLVMASKTIA